MCSGRSKEEGDLKLQQSLSVNSMRKHNLEITTAQLNELMMTRGKETVAMIEEKYGNVEQLCAKLGVAPSEGLDSVEANISLRQRVYGDNKITFKSSKSFLALVWEALQDKTLLMLEISAILSLALSFYKPPQEEELDADPYNQHADEYGFIEALAILFSITIIVFVSAFNDYSKERQFRGLQSRLEKEQKINVLRDRTISEISITSLVVGDVCIVKYGDVIPADGIIFECNELKIDESSLTGESDLVTKGMITDPMLFSGTHVMEGGGRMLVTAVGINSQAGLIYSLMKETEESGDKKSVLQSKLGDLAVKIGYVGIGITFFTIIMLIVRFSVDKFLFQGEKFQMFYLKTFVNFLIVGITILVVAVPEGLPLAVTLSLAYSVKQMMKDNNLVRHLDACETMGNATTICSDKTGTLTANKMTAVQCFICGTYYRNLSKRYIELPAEVQTIVSQNIALNSQFTSRLVKDENNTIKQFGNKTECALLGFLFKVRADFRQIRDNFLQSDMHRIYPFNSTRKLMRTVIRLPQDRGFRILAKGASEIILKRCKYILGAKGEILLLPATETDKVINEVIKKMAEDGLRTIMLAYIDYIYPSSMMYSNCRVIARNKPEPDWDSEESYVDMTCLGVVGIEDPVRKDVPEAIKKCQKAGITVRMITGDNVDTARSIAAKCGIISRASANNPSGDMVLESKEFNRVIRNEAGEVDQTMFDSVWPKLKVLARSTPNDKYILVKHIIESKLNPVREVVAVTGDGTNDAPALKMADVGFAMGLAGTEVAKEASDIILTDDNFSSIVKSVIWGRNVYDSIAKFIQFQLTVNIVAVLIAFVSACVISESPLKAVQMLWVNLIMDTLGSLALSTERPSKALLLRKPYGRNKSIISVTMLKIIVCNAVYQFAIIMLLLFYGGIFFDIDSGIGMPQSSPSSTHFTMIFNIFVFMTLFNEINSRKINGERNVFQGICDNWIFMGIFVTTSFLQVLIVQFGGISFTTVSLSLSQWVWCLTIGFSMLIWGQLVVSVTMKRRDYSWISGMASAATGSYSIYREDAPKSANP